MYDNLPNCCYDYRYNNYEKVYYEDDFEYEKEMEDLQYEYECNRRLED